MTTKKKWYRVYVSGHVLVADSVDVCAASPGEAEKLGRQEYADGWLTLGPDMESLEKVEFSIDDLGYDPPL